MSRQQSRGLLGTAGSMSSSVSSMSMPELPNLPGVRRDVALINPKLYREFKRSQGFDTSAPGTGIAQEEENSLQSYFDGSASKDYSRILSPFPKNSNSYNDLNGRYSLASQRKDRVSKTRSLPYSSTDSVPSFVLNEKKVCCFRAYFSEIPREGVPSRSRVVNIKIYLEDNSIEIVEPFEENSGTSQGKFLKRHQIPKPSVSAEEAGDRGMTPPGVYTVADFYSGAELLIYGRIYVVTDADPSTKRILDDMGIAFGYPQSLPSDIYDPKARPGMTRGSTRAGKRKGKALHFQYDRKVLRFYCIWDCRNTLFGDEMHVKLHYSLSENVMEVVPMHERNSGRDRLPKLLKKSEVMMPPVSPSGRELASSGEFDLTGGSTISSVDSPDKATAAPGESAMASPPASRHAPPSHDPGDSVTSLVSQVKGMVPSRPYHWTDLRIGEELPVASMHILLVDADEFTREFYNSKNMPLGPPIARAPPVYPTVHSEIPPYNGFGSEEDSLATCRNTLVPIPPSKDGAKLKLLSGMVLRFEAMMIDPTEADKMRRFIIQVHLEDDTFQVREPPIRNSGHKGGIFLKRCKLETHDGSKALEPSDLFLGAEVEILTHKFRLYNCDAFTFKFMEENCSKWENSDVNNIIRKVYPKKDVLKRLILTMPALTTRSLDATELEALLRKTGIDLVQQEAHTLFRAVDLYRVGTINMTKFLKFLMELRI